MANIRTPAELMNETEVYERYPNRFADRELREARQRGELEFYDLRKGPHYDEEQLAAYLMTKATKKCQNDRLNDSAQLDQLGKPNGSSRSEGIGSQQKIVALS